MAARNALLAFPDIRIRAYNASTDLKRVEELEKICEAGPSGKVALFTDLLGDPLCRIRNYPAFAMLVAETEPQKQIVGLIRAGVKQVVCGKNVVSSSQLQHVENRNRDESLVTPIFAQTAYILGLRVSPLFRRLGIAAQLVKKMEDWCKEQGAEYVYIATEKDNEASVKLFTQKLGYVKFRTPAILVQPVYARSRKTSSKIQVVKLSRDDAETLYRSIFNTREFFPKDIDAVFRSKLHKGTWIAYLKGEGGDAGGPLKTQEDDVSWAVMSLWKCNEIFKLEMRGASLSIRGFAATTRFVGKLLPIPTLPNVFKPFGMQVMYGLYAHGKKGKELLQKLCWYAHNQAKQEGCQVVAAEVGSCDPLRESIPHWKRISCDEDLWCMKRLLDDEEMNPNEQDWCKQPPTASLFVDPRDF